MCDMILELLSEEIPSSLQSSSAINLSKLITSGMVSAGLTHGTVSTYSTPSRLVIVINNISKKTPKVDEYKRGPNINASQSSIIAFKSIYKLEGSIIIQDTPKGKYYFAKITKLPQPSHKIIKNVIEKVITTFPWKKSMKWGNKNLRWVRPLHSILCFLDGKKISIEIDGISSGMITRGNKFYSTKYFKVDNFLDYKDKLFKQKVILSHSDRIELILKKCEELAKREKLSFIKNDELVNEVAGLVEWPVVLLGGFNADFLNVPKEVLIHSMNKDQKCFPLYTLDGNLSSKFLMVSNIESKDNGSAIIQGNERVMNARFSDANFFWSQDLKISPTDLVKKLKDLIFNSQLGSVKEKVERIQQLSLSIHRHLNLSDDLKEKVRSASNFCKCDLVSNMVREFPSLQGTMGKHYISKWGIDNEIAQSIEDHYKPLGPNDNVPYLDVSILIALADKIDTLVGFFSINEKPTGSKDPFALRRTALGLIRIITENKLSLDLLPVIQESYDLYKNLEIKDNLDNVISELMGFIRGRFSVYLKELKGIPIDCIEATLTDSVTKLYDASLRVDALNSFLNQPEGGDLLQAYRRARNLVEEEEKKIGKNIETNTLKELLIEEAEIKLSSILSDIEFTKSKDYLSSLKNISGIRQPIDLFFDQVTVNVKDMNLKNNRLSILARVRNVIEKVADLSKIEG